MKTFLKRLAAFLAVPAAVAAAWLAFAIGCDFASYRAALKAPDGASVAVCGDSQTKDALDPALFPGLFNFSNAASSHDQNLLRLRDLLDANPGRFQTVLIDASPLKLGFDPTTPISEMASARVHLTIHLYHPFAGKRPLGRFCALVRDVLFARKFHEFRKAALKGRWWRSSLAGGFAPDSTKGFTNPRYRKRAQEDVADKAARIGALPPATGSEALFAALAEEAAAVRERGAVPVFTVMPLSPALLKAADDARLEAFSRAVSAFAQRENAPLLDFMRHPTEESWWHDANHLNRTGAAAFTPVFVEKFAAIAAQPRTW